MLWSDCPIIHDCEKCLEVEFESEKDIACLDNKWADNSCVFEGKLVEGGSRVFVSSEQCLINGDLSIIQVLKFIYSEKAQKVCEISTKIMIIRIAYNYDTGTKLENSY